MSSKPIPCPRCKATGLGDFGPCTLCAGKAQIADRRKRERRALAATPTPDATITSTVERCAKVADEVEREMEVAFDAHKRDKNELSADRCAARGRTANLIAARIRALAAPTADGEVDNG